MKLCKNSKNLSQGLEIKLWCIPCNSVCLCYKYCTTKKCIIHTNSYTTCPYRQKAGDQMNEKVDIVSLIEPNNIEEESYISSPIEETITPLVDEKIKKPKISKPKIKKQICNIINKTDKRFSIDFNGDGISFKDSSPTKTDKVEITYVGEYKTKFFKIESYKFL